MAIDFPNQSRSYDSKHHGVRFWGHDDACEVCFLVEEDALCQLDRTTSRNEAGLLGTFDGHRDRIMQAARKAYFRRGNGFYVLAASNF